MVSALKPGAHACAMRAGSLVPDELARLTRGLHDGGERRVAERLLGRDALLGLPPKQPPRQVEQRLVELEAETRERVLPAQRCYELLTAARCATATATATAILLSTVAASCRATATATARCSCALGAAAVRRQIEVVHSVAIRGG